METEVKYINSKKRIGSDILCTALHQLLINRNSLQKSLCWSQKRALSLIEE
jgi:hypothetical protein